LQHDDTAEMIGTLLSFSPMGVFETAPMLVKFMLIIIGVAGIVAVIAAVFRRVSNGPKSTLLPLAGQVGLYAGLAGAGYQATMTGIAVKATHVTRFVIYEPQVIETVFVLLAGVIVYLIARFGNAGAKRA
jgi:hypothetical protein